MAWKDPTTTDEVQRRAAGRAKYNSVRQTRAKLRRRQIVELMVQLGSWNPRGAQARLARTLGVSQTTISRDMARLAREIPVGPKRCPICGARELPEQWPDYRPRSRL